MNMELLSRKDSIIISTIEAINEVGIQNLSTKIIAQYQGVSEGTLFRHFKNKTEVMLSVLEYFSQFDDDIIASSRNKTVNAIERLKYFVYTYSEYYENYPTITALVQAYDTLIWDDNLREKVRDIYNKRCGFILSTILEGQQQGILNSDINGRIMEDLISGGFREICVKWRMEKFSFHLKEKINDMMEVLLNSFIQKCDS